MMCDYNKQMNDIGAQSGIVFDIQSYSIRDGPGIRTNVFLKGCPLRCLWCHNPEGIRRELGLSFNKERCWGCGRCFSICPVGAHIVKAGIHFIDRERCIACGRCCSECRGGALELVGRSITAVKVVEQVMRDKAFYAASGGGITLSGGEPTMQPEFALAILLLAGKQGIHRAIETCGCFNYEKVKPIFDQTELVLFDWKETNSIRHREYTGTDNAQIERNLRALRQDGRDMRLRCPIIPELNDRKEHFAGIANLSSELGIEVELLGYHALGVSKARHMDMPYQEFAAPNADLLEKWKEMVSDMGGKVFEP